MLGIFSDSSGVGVLFPLQKLELILLLLDISPSTCRDHLPFLACGVRPPIDITREVKSQAVRWKVLRRQEWTHHDLLREAFHPMQSTRAPSGSMPSRPRRG